MERKVAKGKKCGRGVVMCIVEVYIFFDSNKSDIENETEANIQLLCIPIEQ